MNFYTPIFLLSACFANIFPTLVAGITQETINQIATNMDIKHDILSNLDDGLRTFQVQLTITNRGKTAIPKDGWVIYICYIRMVEPNHLPDPEGVVIDDIKFTHLQGCIFTLEPASTFKAIQPNEVKTVKFLAENWIVSKTDIMPNWYVTAPGLTPRTITSTAGDSLNFVGNFDKVEKWKRYDYKENSDEAHDKYDPYTTKYRYAINDIKNLGKSPGHVIPTPLQITVYDNETISLETRDWVVVYPDELLNEADYLTKNLPVTKTKSKTLNRYIELKIEPIKVEINGKLQEKPEAYTLEVISEKECIKITGQDASGVFYGIQSLMSLASDNYVIPRSIIKDAPRFTYRGMEFDVARNFFSKKTVFKLLNTMASYKLNRFHFHLSDDEGWRLAFDGLNELTEVGGHRCHDPSERHCIMPQLGSGPTKVGSGSGFYTKKDYQEILEYAKERHIQVIPEIDMPGHSHALNKAMQSRYQNLLQQGNINEAKRYVLIDQKDTSKYKSIQMYTDNAINPCLESTYDFIERIVKSLIEYHSGIMPLKIYHFGGDEVAKGTWENSTACDEFINKSSNLQEKAVLKEYFVQKLSNITARHGINLAAWEDGVMKSGSVPFNISALKNNEIYAYAWDNVWEWGQSNRAYKLANNGYKVVMSQATHLYFDHPYEPDPEEPGYYWATRFTDTRKTFGFMPENIYANAKVARSGEPLTEVQLCGKHGKDCVQLEKFENLAGIQGHLWSETVRSPERFEFMVYPRLLALSERAWHRAAWEQEKDKNIREENLKKDWERFANIVGYREMKRLERLGIKYRVPPPGAVIQDDQLKVNTAFPGLIVQFSVNGGKTWRDVDDTAETDKSVLLRTRSASGGRYSRVVELKSGKSLAVSSVIVKNGYTQLISLVSSFLSLIICTVLLGQA